MAPRRAAGGGGALGRLLGSSGGVPHAARPTHTAQPDASSIHAMRSDTLPQTVNSAEEALANAFGFADVSDFNGVGGARTVEATFIPSHFFSGLRNGYVFKSGAHGLGYYLDAAQPCTGDTQSSDLLCAGSGSLSSADARNVNSTPDDNSLDGTLFTRAANFDGARSGYVFKLGQRGLGYYLDKGTPIKTAIVGSSGGRATARSKGSEARSRGFRFGGDNRERTLRAFCERSMQHGTLTSVEVEAVMDSLERCSPEERGAAMLQIVGDGLRGKDVVVVGATGRTPRGWWGDETVGRVLCTPRLFDASRPELLPVRVPLRSSALGSRLGETAIPEVMDVGIHVTNLRLRPTVQPCARSSNGGSSGVSRAAGAFTTRARQLYSELLTAARSVSSEQVAGLTVPSVADVLSEMRSVPDASGAARLMAESEVAGEAGDSCVESARCNTVLVQLAGTLQWQAELMPCVLPLRLSIEHLWSGDGKTHIIERCCQLDLLQTMRPLSAWPGQGPPADYVVNLGPVTRAGTPNPQLRTWYEEAGSNVEFRKLVQLKEALQKRGVGTLQTFDSLFMRLYASLAAIPSHRDEGRRRVRIVGNMGRNRVVSFHLHAVSDAASVVVDNAERLELVIQHGWAYALTDEGSGRLPLRRDVLLPGSKEPVHLFAAHEVQKTSADAPLTMAWVVDLDEASCGGDARVIVQRFQEAVLEVMVSSGMSLDNALEPARLPSPFIYRPFEALASVQDSERQTDTQTVDEDTAFIMRVRCGVCSHQHWLPTQEDSRGCLVLSFPPKLHENQCPLADATRVLRPSLKMVGVDYQLQVGGELAAATVPCVGVRLKVIYGLSTWRVKMSLEVVTARTDGKWSMYITECQPVADQRH